jgi:hypothetical protein
MRQVVLLAVAACGDDGRTLPAADAPAAELPGGLERVDWRATRGSPIRTTTVSVPSGELFALSADGFVTRSECQDPRDCTFSWRGLSGEPTLSRDHMGPVTITSVSPDGRRALLVALHEIEACNESQAEFPVARGALQLLDLATGSASFELELRSNFWSAPAFTPLGDWFVAAPIEGTACIAERVGHRSSTSPFAPPPGLDATDQLVQMVAPSRWLVARGPDFGFADPHTRGSFVLLGREPSRFDVSRGWLHVYLGFGDLAQEVVSVPPDGPVRETALRDEDWFPFGSLGRWIRICRIQQPEGYRDCRVVDAHGEMAPVDFRVSIASDHPDDAVLLDSGAVVFVGPTDDGARAVQRIVFATGDREILHVGNGTLRSLGDGTAALLIQNGVAWLVEAGREELVAEEVSHVVTVPTLGLLFRTPGRQDDVALLVSSVSGRHSLVALDVHTRRLALVTDNLYFTPPVGASFAFDDRCGQPWTTRTGGQIIDGLFQQPQQVFFVEEGTPATLWLFPLDLSAPPRRLAQLTEDPSACHAPLASPDGRRVGFAEAAADGTRITLSAKR